MCSGSQIMKFYFFFFAGINLAASNIMNKMFSSFEKTCPLREVKLPELNPSLVLRSLTFPPYEPLKLSSNKHLTQMLALALAKLRNCAVQQVLKAGI